jgi:hypothetical protein
LPLLRIDKCRFIHNTREKMISSIACLRKTKVTFCAILQLGKPKMIIGIVKPLFDRFTDILSRKVRSHQKYRFLS